MLPGAPRVINLEPESLNEVMDAIRLVATATGTEDRADSVVTSLTDRIEAVKTRTARLAHRPRVALIEWLDPPFSCGHWNPELVRLAGGVEGLGREGERSRTLAWDEVITWQPEVVVIACCGFSAERTMQELPLLEAVPGWSDLPAARSERIYVVDGSQYFSRPGPRLVDSLELLAHAIHPDVHPLPPGLPEPICSSLQRTPGSMRAR
jgi:iron complex transport system substrate-binding protein